MDGNVGEESVSEDEESSGSSDEMIFDHPKASPFLSGRDSISTANEKPPYLSRTSDASMPGSDILENIDTPPPFRKRTLQVTEDVKQRLPSNVSPTTSPRQVVNGQLDG